MVPRFPLEVQIFQVQREMTIPYTDSLTYEL